MAAKWPFTDRAAMARDADAIWSALAPEDWLEAFAAHPRIGDRPASQWSQQEQAGIASARGGDLDEIARLNREYERRFGYIFIICASGKSAEQMLDALRTRLQNTPDEELQTAAEQQRQIMQLRLLKLISQ